VRWRWVTNYDVNEDFRTRSARQRAWVKKNYLDPLCLTDVPMCDGRPVIPGSGADVAVDNPGAPQIDGAYPQGGLYIPYDIYLHALLANNPSMTRSWAENFAHLPPDRPLISYQVP